jgi:hypothetical protein
VDALSASGSVATCGARGFSSADRARCQKMQHRKPGHQSPQARGHCRKRRSCDSARKRRELRSRPKLGDQEREKSCWPAGRRARAVASPGRVRPSVERARWVRSKQFHRASKTRGRPQLAARATPSPGTTYNESKLWLSPLLQDLRVLLAQRRIAGLTLSTVGA